MTGVFQEGVNCSKPMLTAEMREKWAADRSAFRQFFACMTLMAPAVGSWLW
jgi:hypothetical protein